MLREVRSFLQKMQLKSYFVNHHVQDENERTEEYRRKFENLKLLYDQLMEDSQHFASHDSSDVVRQQKQARAKNIQLEHQVQRLTEAAELRADLLGEVENAAYEIQEMVSGNNPIVDIKVISKKKATRKTKLTDLPDTVCYSSGCKSYPPIF